MTQSLGNCQGRRKYEGGSILRISAAGIYHDRYRTRALELKGLCDALKFDMNEDEN